MTLDPSLPAAAYAAALAGLPGMGPSRLLALLQSWPPPVAWSRVLDGRAVLDASAKGGVGAWPRAARTTDVAASWAACRAAGIGVQVLGAAGYPALLEDDVAPPAVLFHRGELDALDGRRVAVVGTRQCTVSGRRFARQLGLDLAAAGVRVVSGLALGIDGAAHEGALDAGGAPPVGVVGSGLEVVYPRRHRHLWEAVGARGVLLSEAVPWAAPEPWRFPARNRIIAALAEVVVVVESHPRGGSRYTVDAALDRCRTIMAVPGSVHVPASAGTNELLAQGFPPARDATDVLVALGLSTASTGSPAHDPRPAPDGTDSVVLDALGGEPATVEQVMLRTGLALGPVAVSLSRLERHGWAGRQDAWWERLPPAASAPSGLPASPAPPDRRSSAPRSLP